MSRALDYLRADLHRAQHNGVTMMEVSTLDVAELVAKLEKLEKRGAIEFGGKPLGFCKGHKMRAMLNGSRSFITISRFKNENFDTPVSFTELPPVQPDADGGAQ